MIKKHNNVILEVILNITFSLIGAVTLIWAIRYASTVYTSIALGLFLFSRRIGSTLANFLQLGLSKSLTRYVSIDQTEKGKKGQYIISSVLIWLIVGIITINLFFFYRTKLADFVYPNLENNIDILFWTLIFAWSLVLNYFIRSTFIAERNIILANIIETINASGFLIISLLLIRGSDNVIPVLRIHSLSIITFSIIVLALYIFSIANNISDSFQGILRTGKKLLGFGFPRALISTMDMMVLLIGPWLIRERVDQSGYLIISLSALRIIQTMIKPIMEITSTITARFLGNKQQKRIKTGIDIYFQIVLFISVMATAFLFLWSDFLISLWIQDPTVVFGVNRGLSILIWAIVPFTIFHSLKGIIEMNWTTPYNLVTLTIGIALQVLTFFVLRTYYPEEIAINLSILLSYFSIGIMTVFWLKPTLSKKIILDLLILFIISFILVYTNRYLTIDPTIIKLLISIGLYCLIFFIYIMFYPSDISNTIRELIRKGEIVK